ncbi:hypothetical protein [Paremcibacter congregatus]|uniref:Uncharacterized protein n=1 Tax=Paremcibacter congregatus TaxID=2043170 RepID=A0A2G4YTG9_9PROT|nr:hypothetical protein [Paremcibacter congregatus]PHZ85540.1 hypothetical protein CRD36_02265 [Paremcibacter congregatus]QDE26500.1 hypothetical protein FIV45_04030 [Paremcibacter congregatus]
MSASHTRTHALIVAGVITLLLVSGLANMPTGQKERSGPNNDGSQNRTTATCWLSECSLV